MTMTKRMVTILKTLIKTLKIKKSYDYENNKTNNNAKENIDIG